jgi:hypothetical protein
MILALWAALGVGLYAALGDWALTTFEGGTTLAWPRWGRWALWPYGLYLIYRIRHEQVTEVHEYVDPKQLESEEDEPPF